jgi:peptidoglycan/xylan/chitin deacetylase (PgdA/CDA1 family)
MNLVKRAFKRAITLPGAASVFRPLLRDCGVIFMLHRFSVPDVGIVGDDPPFVRAVLEQLRRDRREFLSLTDVFSRLVEGRPLRGAIAFTIDDGYREQATLAADAFAAFDCPVTVFATSGFLDGRLWFWWDKIEYVFAHTTRPSIRVTLADHALEYRLADQRARQSARGSFTEACKRVPDAAKHAAIEELARSADVPLPDLPPPQYAPASWDEIRRAEERGMTFGPHTVTHPILSQTPDEQSAFEITESWSRLRSELHHPVPVFCYPNGQLGDFGPREMRTIEEIGLQGAVLGTSGYARGEHVREARDARYQVPRFPLPPNESDLLQYVSGIERMKQLVRGAA